MTPEQTPAGAIVATLVENLARVLAGATGPRVIDQVVGAFTLAVLVILGTIILFGAFARH